MSDRSKHQQRVDQCMVGWSQEIPAFPAMPDERVRILRARLIMEECLETISKGLGVDVRLIFSGIDPDSGRPLGCSHTLLLDVLDFKASGEPDLIELADGCADILVVTTGTLSAAGISDKPLLKEVDKNNLLKIKTGHLNPVTGKFEKHPDHPVPDIARVLEDQADAADLAEALADPENAEPIPWEEANAELNLAADDLAQAVDVLQDQRETFEESVARIDKTLGLVDLGISARALSELKSAWETRQPVRPFEFPEWAVKAGARDKILLDCSKIVSDLYGPDSSAVDKIRDMGSDMLRIRPITRGARGSLDSEEKEEVLVGSRVSPCGKSWCSESMPCSECSGAERKLF